MKTRYPKHKSKKQKQLLRRERHRNGELRGEFLKTGLGRALQRLARVGNSHEILL